MKNLKKAMLVLLPTTFVAGSASVMTATIIIHNLNGQTYQYLKFDNKLFSNKEEVLNYATKKAEKSNYLYKTNTYSLDGKIFKTFSELENYIDSNFKIVEIPTILNPNNYLIKGNDELSSLVANYQNDKVMQVYEGKNGLAYDNEKQARNTFHNFETVYDVEGTIRYNENDAIRVYEDILEENLKTNPMKKTVYSQGGILQTEQQIKDWLYDNQKVGFEYNGNIYSDFNNDKFHNDMNNMPQAFYDKYIIEIPNPDLKTYWLTDYKQVTKNKAYYIGPKYIETTEELKKDPDWKLVDSYDPGLLFSMSSTGQASQLIASTAFDYQTVETFDWRFHSDWENDVPIKRFFDFLYRNKFISFDMYEKRIKYKNEGLYSFFDHGLENILVKSTDNLDQIDQEHNPDFGSIQKMFVAFNRIITNVKLVQTELGTVKTVSDILKDVALSVLKTNNTAFSRLLNDFYDALIKEVPGLKNKDSDTIDDFFDFENLYNFFMNPTRFFEEGNPAFEKSLELQKSFEHAMDNIFEFTGAITTITDSSLKIKSKRGVSRKNNSKPKTTALDNEENSDNNEDYFNDDSLSEDIKEMEDNVDKVIQKNIGQDESILLNAWGIKDNRQQKNQVNVGPQFLPILAVVAIIVAIWSIQKLLSFVSWKTFEFKIDGRQSGYYVMPVYKVPLVGVEVGTKKPVTEINKIGESLLDYLPIDEGKAKSQKVWEFEDTYYFSEEAARNELINQIELHPERYLYSRKILSSIMENDEGYYLPKELEEKEVIEDEKNTDESKITKLRYDELIDLSKKNYSQLLFDHYYKEASSKELYLDGFGNGYSTAEAALQSMKEKLINPKNFITKIEYQVDKTRKIYFDTVEQAIEYVDQNKVINSKLVLASDLRKNANYAALKMVQEANFKVYELDFYGTKKYFATKLGAQNYLMKHLKYSQVVKDETLKIYYWDDEVYYGQEKFKDWIESNTEQLTTNSKQGGFYNEKDF